MLTKQERENKNTVLMQSRSHARENYTYRFCGDVEFREVSELARVDRVKIVACDAETATQPPTVESRHQAEDEEHTRVKRSLARNARMMTKKGRENRSDGGIMTAREGKSGRFC